MLLTHDSYLLTIDENAMLAHEAFIDLDPSAPVPGCPGWPASELRDHISGVFAFWAHQLGRATTEGPDFPDLVREGYRRPILENSAVVVAALRSLGPDGVCWNWSGTNMTSGWAARRMAHEITVHRVDAQMTASAGVDHTSPRIDTDLATDGIEEMLDVHVGSPETIPGLDDPIMRIATPGGQWTVAIGENVARVDDNYPGRGTTDISPQQPASTEPASIEPGLTINGPTDAVLLHLWGRPFPVDFVGDPTVFDAWKALSVFN